MFFQTKNITVHFSKPPWECTYIDILLCDWKIGKKERKNVATKVIVYIKIHVFWESHKNLAQSSSLFWYYQVINVKHKRKVVPNFCGFPRKPEFKCKAHHTHLSHRVAIPKSRQFMKQNSIIFATLINLN